MTIGQQLQKARKKEGLTQAQLADKCHLATITIQQYERDKRQPSIAQLAEIARILNTRIEDIVGLETFDTGGDFQARWKNITENSNDPGIEIRHKADGGRILIDHRKEKLDGIYRQLDDSDQQQFIKYGEFLLSDPKYKEEPPQD